MDKIQYLWNLIHTQNIDEAELFKIDSSLSHGIGKCREARERVKQRLAEIGGSPEALDSFSKAYKYYGFNLDAHSNCYTFREWLPGASEVYLVGDFNNWNKSEYPLSRNEFGVWEIKFEANQFPFKEGDKYKLYLKNARGEFVFRNPAYAERAVQDPTNKVFDASFVTRKPFNWQHPSPKPNDALRIYECHIGLSSEREEVAQFSYFMKEVLPKIKELGYNSIQIMAVAEHAYYGSFGYHVTNFFAVSSRFGSIEAFKELVDAAHGLGILVFMDIVHSHASSNALDGIGDMDGTDHLYFHSGAKGYHRDWDSRLFDYGKHEVLKFLLSNARWWVDEFNVDGFRFDGVTCILYKHHGEVIRYRFCIHRSTRRILWRQSGC
jgi:1,4-alpha-glucan branching enzyme